MAQNEIIYLCGHKAPDRASIFKKMKRALSIKEQQSKDIPIQVHCERCRCELASDKLNACLVEIEIEDGIEKARKKSQTKEAAGVYANTNPSFDKKAEEQKIEIDFWRDRMDRMADEELEARNRAEEYSEN